MKFLQIAALAGAAAAVSLMEVSEDEKAGLRELAGEYDFDLDEYMKKEGKSWDDVKREAKEEAPEEFDGEGELKRAKKPKGGKNRNPKAIEDDPNRKQKSLKEVWKVANKTKTKY